MDGNWGNCGCSEVTSCQPWWWPGRYADASSHAERDLHGGRQLQESLFDDRDAADGKQRRPGTAESWNGERTTSGLSPEAQGVVTVLPEPSAQSKNISSRFRVELQIPRL